MSTGGEDRVVVGTVMAMAVLGDMDMTIGAPSSLESLSLSPLPIVPALPTRATEGGDVRRRERALMARHGTMKLIVASL